MQAYPRLCGREDQLRRWPSARTILRMIARSLVLSVASMEQVTWCERNERRRGKAGRGEQDKGDRGESKERKRFFFIGPD